MEGGRRVAESVDCYLDHSKRKAVGLVWGNSLVAASACKTGNWAVVC